MKKILFVGAEAMPFAATGGLGDVMGSLPAAIAAADENVDVRVVMPLYAQVTTAWRSQMTKEAEFNVQLAWRNQYCAVYSLVKDKVTYYFIDNEYYFARDTLYGQFDDGERYAYFCRAVMEMMRQLDYYPDILHAHDWQAALSVVYLNLYYRHDARYGDIRTVFTIHNIEYQGKYDFSILGDVFAIGCEHCLLMNYDGCINLMKAAIECADRVSTVSPRYAEEILSPEYAHGLHHCLKNHTGKLCGILNGIDYDYYNPKTGSVIPQHFSAASIHRKYANKLAFQREAGLPENADVPLLAIISRLATHKGLDLITEIAYNLMKEQNAQLVILGKGEAKYEQFFLDLQEKFPDKVRALIQYDRDLALRIYAACDIFLMPSRSEPCGLSQMIASRYGAIPVTRETGGLYDSIKGYWKSDDGEMHGNGFTFANYSSAELAERTTAAIALYENAKDRKALVKKIMDTDFSWNVSAERYLDMYRSL
jgi:starch synthase